jgi:SSS family solute:Na+ symporter
MLGLFWKRANEAGALAAAIGSFVLSIALKLAWPALPFIDRVGLVFLLSLALAVLVSLLTPAKPARDSIDTTGVDYATPTGFRIGGFGVVAILVALYAAFW